MTKDDLLKAETQRALREGRLYEHCMTGLSREEREEYEAVACPECVHRDVCDAQRRK